MKIRIVSIVLIILIMGVVFNTRAQVIDSIGAVMLPQEIFSMAVSGDYAYIHSFDSLQVVDISDPSNPYFIGSCWLPGAYNRDAIAFYNNNVFVPSFELGIMIIDVSNPLWPNYIRRFGSSNQGREISDIAINWPYLYALGSEVLIVNDLPRYHGFLTTWDLSNISHPDSIGTFHGSWQQSQQMSISENYAYLTSYYSNSYLGNLEIVDISNPISPLAVGHIPTNSPIYDIWVDGNYALMTTGDLPIIDISNKTYPFLLFNWGINAYASQVFLEGRYIYVSNGGENNYATGITIFDNNALPYGIVSVASRQTTGYTNELFVRDNHIYAAIESTLTIFRFDPDASNAHERQMIAYSPSLSQNYPNPFNATTTISYELPKASNVRIEIYDIGGRKVAILDEGKQEAGKHSIQWNARSLSSGVYFYRIKAGKFTETKKLVLMK